MLEIIYEDSILFLKPRVEVQMRQAFGRTIAINIFSTSWEKPKKKFLSTPLPPKGIYLLPSRKKALILHFRSAKFPNFLDPTTASECVHLSHFANLFFPIFRRGDSHKHPSASLQAFEVHFLPYGYRGGGGQFRKRGKLPLVKVL